MYSNVSVFISSSEKNFLEKEKQSGYVNGEYVPTKLYESVRNIGDSAVEMPVNKSRRSISFRINDSISVSFFKIIPPKASKYVV